MNQGPYGQPPQPYPQEQGYPQQQQGYPPPYGQGYPPPQFQQRPQDDEGHLNILAICTFCYAGLIGLFGLFFSIYLILGIVMAGSAVSTGGSSAGAEATVGGIFIVIGALAMLFMWGKAALLIWSGLSLRKRTRPTLSFVVGCISCMNIPLGTTLGIFTIMVLNRPSVKALYAQRAAQLG